MKKNSLVKRFKKEQKKEKYDEDRALRKLKQRSDRNVNKKETIDYKDLTKKQRFVRVMKKQSRALAPYSFSILTFIILTALISAIVLQVFTQVSTVFINPLAPHKTVEWVLLAAWAVSAVISAGTIIWTYNKQELYLLQITSCLGLATFFSTVLSFLYRISNKIDQVHLTQAINNMSVTDYGAIIIFAIFGLFAIFVTRKNTEENNWFLLVPTIPFLAAIRVLYNSHLDFMNFINGKDFKVKIFLEMIKETPHGDINLINDLQYRLFSVSIVIAVVIIILGVSTFVFKKTKNWEAKKESI